MSTPADTKPILCHAALEAPLTASGEIMFMPAGVQRITPSQGGKAVSVEVLVTRESAAELERQRMALEARGKRPYFDLNHEDREASFWPVSFFWKDGPAAGVYARGEWTATGSAAVEGKSYRQFSPVFFVDDTKARPSRIVCRETAKPNMGGLVNDPAFTAILPFWAKDATPLSSADAGENAGASSESVNQQNKAHMNEQELAALQAKNQELQNEIDALKAKTSQDAADKAALAAKQAEHKTNVLTLENEALKAKAAKQEQAIAARNAADAKAAVADAVSRGAIAAKDADTIAAWERDITENPARAALLAKMPGNPALVGGRVAGKTGSVQIGATGIIDTVRAFNALNAKQATCSTMADKALVAKEVAALYASDLRGKQDFESLPLVCDNSLGTAAGTLVTMRTLELLKFTFPMLSAITADFSDQPANYGQQVTTRTLGLPTVGTYSTSTGYAQTDQSASDISITINRHKYVQTTFHEEVLAGTMRRLFDEFAPASAYALAKDLVDALYALITTAFTQTAVTAALADFSRDVVIDMGVAQNLAGVPMGASNRTLLLYSTYFGKLSKDSGAVINAITALAAFNRPEIITEGVLPDIHGYKVVDAPNLPSTGNLAGFGFSKSALGVATRVPSDYTTILPGASFGNVQVVTNPDTGLSVLQTQFADHTLGNANQRIAMMSGVARGQIAAGQRLVSA